VVSTQYGEHELILEHFKGRIGSFLDIGAGDGFVQSNTCCLAELGWSGVMVEPSLSQLQWLIDRHGKNPLIEILPMAVTGNQVYRDLQVCDFHDARDFSTVLKPQVDLITTLSEGDIKFRRRLAPYISVEQLIKVLGRDTFDFVNIDVEGMALDVLRAVVVFVKSEMICVEIEKENEEYLYKGLLAYYPNQQRIEGNLLAWK
jgi:FkbM family methyltransferase